MGVDATGSLAAVHVGFVVLHRVVECLLPLIVKLLEACDFARIWQDGINAVGGEVSAGVARARGNFILPHRLLLPALTATKSSCTKEA